ASVLSNRYQRLIDEAAVRAHCLQGCRIRIAAEQGAHMSTIRFHQTTTATPEQFIAGLTDFGPGRSKLFGNSAEVKANSATAPTQLLQGRHATYAYRRFGGGPARPLL